MHEYDVALKLLLRASADSVLKQAAEKRHLDGAPSPSRLGSYSKDVEFWMLLGSRQVEDNWLGKTVRDGAKTMPVLTDIMSHDVLGPAILQGRQEIVHRLLDKRFGPVSSVVEARLTTMSAPELDDLAVRLQDATKVEEVFPTDANS